MTSLSVVNGKPVLGWTPYPGADAYSIHSTLDLSIPFSTDYSGSITGLTFTPFNLNSEARFFRVVATPMSSNNLLAGIALNRLAYGPTPDDLEQLLDRHPVTGATNTTSTNFLRWTNQAGQEFSGAAAYIAQQLEPWRITETVTNTHTNIAFIANKLMMPTTVVGMVTTNGTNTYVVTTTNAGVADLRAWYVQHAVGAKRQLLEVFLQFLDNHFTSSSTTSSNYLSSLIGTLNVDSSLRNAITAGWEFWEIDRWRQALLNPECTFYDLLKISAESPASIVYLNRVSSRGDGSNVPSENYARELLELYTFGKDNGYEQTDMTELSKVWTGWTIDLLHPTNTFNPFATKTTNRIPGAANGANSNLYAVAAFRYNSAYAKTGSKRAFTNYTAGTTGPAGADKTVPPRFGVDWASDEFKAGYSYVLDVPARIGTNLIQDGYQTIAHLANQPFTAENICAKLCRLLVHDNFPVPSTLTNQPGYAFYDYSSSNLTAEAELVRQCMRAWESATPKGQIWKVVEVIVNSDLFRTQAAASQKIKTPLEFTASAIRALRSSTNGTGLPGSFSAFTDGYALAPPFGRMGPMNLFDPSQVEGWPEDSGSWLTVAPLIERIRWAQSLCIANGQSGHNASTNDAGNSVTDVRGLVFTKLPTNLWSSATAVADYLVRVIYPTEGRGNLDAYHKMAVTFLNNGSADANPLDRTKNFSQLTVDTTANSSYDVRLRGAAALLLSLQRFQEQ